MKNFLYILIICGGAVYGYQFFLHNPSLAPSFLFSGGKNESSTPPAATPAEIPLPSPPAGHHYVKCSRCQGEGRMKCPARGCVDGMVDCPGPCLKLSVGIWERNIRGLPPGILGRKFPYADGNGYYAWSEHHLGQVIEMVNGEPKNMGACKICGGKGKVTCGTCNGAGTVVCNVCGGRKMILAMNSGASAPAMMPAGAYVTTERTEGGGGIIKLKNGKTIHGKIVIMDAENAVIRTSDGKTVEVPASDVIVQP